MKLEVSESHEMDRVGDVIVTADEYEALRQGAIDAVAKRAVLPGFRRGKVPRDIVMERFADKIEGRIVADLHKKIREVFVDFSDGDVVDSSIQCNGLAESNGDGCKKVSVSFSVRPKPVAPDWRSFRLPESFLSYAGTDEKKLINQIDKQVNAIGDFFCKSCRFQLSKFDVRDQTVAELYGRSEELLKKGVSFEEINTMSAKLIEKSEASARKRLIINYTLDAIAKEEKIEADSSAMIELILGRMGSFVSNPRKFNKDPNAPTVMDEITSRRRTRAMEFVRCTLAGEEVSQCFFGDDFGRSMGELAEFYDSNSNEAIDTRLREEMKAMEG